MLVLVVAGEQYVYFVADTAITDTDYTQVGADIIAAFHPFVLQISLMV